MFTSLIRRAPAALSWRAACRQARALVVCALLPLAACATHPPATSLDRPVSHALSADIATPLRDALASPEAAHPGQSGFRLLADGATALQMRIALARAATKTLDMQYYIATEDTTGKLLLAAALYAADRGVRVRMLVDDLNFHDIDRVMAALNTHQNIEIRVFNPFGASQRGMVERTANFFTRIDSFTRRMHNKAMIADNQLAIVGGRNLGDEYFSAVSDTAVPRSRRAGRRPRDERHLEELRRLLGEREQLSVARAESADVRSEGSRRDARRVARPLAKECRSVQREAAERDAARTADRARRTRTRVGACRIQGRCAGQGRAADRHVRGRRCSAWPS